MESPKINQSKSSYQRRYDARNERLFDAIIIAIDCFHHRMFSYFFSSKK